MYSPAWHWNIGIGNWNISLSLVIGLYVYRLRMKRKPIFKPFIMLLLLFPNVFTLWIFLPTRLYKWIKPSIQKFCCVHFFFFFDQTVKYHLFNTQFYYALYEMLRLNSVWLKWINKKWIFMLTFSLYNTRTNIVMLSLFLVKYT